MSTMVKKDIRVDKVKKNFYLTLVLLMAVLTITYAYPRPLALLRCSSVTKGERKQLSEEYGQSDQLQTAGTL